VSLTNVVHHTACMYHSHWLTTTTTTTVTTSDDDDDDAEDNDNDNDKHGDSYRNSSNNINKQTTFLRRCDQGC
jgi:hypothetical protein